MLIIYKHNFELKYKEIQPKFQGPFLRGGLGFHLKKLIPLKEYDYIFNTPTDTKIMKRYPEAPKAFVIDLPYTPCLNMPFSLILFAKSNCYFDSLKKALILHTQQNNIELFYNGCEESEGDFTQIKDTFTIKFETPTYITYKGRIWEKPEFHIIIRNLLRRIFIIGYYHYNVKLPIDFNTLIEDAQNVSLVDYDWQLEKTSRFSSRKNQVMSIFGYMGHATYHVNDNVKHIQKLLGYLTLGEQIHAGKNTVFGCGKILLSYSTPYYAGKITQKDPPNGQHLTF